MNMGKSVMYDSILKEVERKSINCTEFREVYNFHRLEKVRQVAERLKRSNQNLDWRSKCKLRLSLEKGQIVLVSTDSENILKVRFLSRELMTINHQYICANTGKYKPEKTPYLESFHAVFCHKN